MEERLRELKRTMRRNKEVRDSKGYSWRSGRKGNVTSHASDVLRQNQARRQAGRRMRLLTGDEEINMPSRPTARSRPPPARSNGVGRRGQYSYQSRPKPPKTDAPGSADSNSLLSGDFDEAESHNSFLSALEDWRSGGKPPAAES